MPSVDVNKQPGAIYFSYSPDAIKQAFETTQLEGNTEIENEISEFAQTFTNASFDEEVIGDNEVSFALLVNQGANTYTSSNTAHFRGFTIQVNIV